MPPSLGITIFTAIMLAGAALVLALAALAANPSLTALAAATTGLGGYLYFGAPSRIRRRAIGAFLAVAAVLPLVPAARARLADLAYHVRSRNLEALLSYRAGPWAAAVEMTREHPLLGVGPGGFESRFVPARLAAEQRLRRSFVAESAAGSYAQAHSEAYAAQCGTLRSRLHENAGQYHGKNQGSGHHALQRHGPAAHKQPGS